MIKQEIELDLKRFENTLYRLTTGKFGILESSENSENLKNSEKLETAENWKIRKDHHFLKNFDHEYERFI